MALFGTLIRIDEADPEIQRFGPGVEGVRSFLANQKGNISDFKVDYRRETSVGWNPVDQIDAILRLPHPSDVLTDLSLIAYDFWRGINEPAERAFANRNSILIDVGRFYALRSRSLSSIDIDCFRRYRTGMRFELAAEHFKTRSSGWTIL